MPRFVRYFTFISSFFLFFGYSISATFALDRIGVRQGAAGGEFYDTTTGTKFTPRGNNYLILGNQLDPQTNTTVQNHIIFDPGKYNSTDVDLALAYMQQSGYNTVRIFLADNTIGNPAGGLSQIYMDNFADFLTKAATRNIYVLPVLYALPKQGGYYPAASTLTTQFEGFNTFYMAPSFIAAKKKYAQDFIAELHKRNAPTDHILGYEMENEVMFFLNSKPFTIAGSVQTAAGTYDMTNAVQRQQAMDANLVNWGNQVDQAIKQVEPSALTTVSMFPTTASATLPYPNASRAYWLFIYPANGGSAVDFVDIHPYPWIAPLAQQMADYQISNNKKPIIIGEFGADKGHYPNLVTAVTVMRDWQVQSCQYNIQGWIAWAWGQSSTNQNGYWSVEESNGALNGVLAPIARANPCIAANSTPTPTPSPTTKPGDLNGDGKVDIFDYNLLVTNFGHPYTIFDYNQLVANLGK